MDHQVIGYCGYSCHLCARQFESMPTLVNIMAAAGKVPSRLLLFTEF